MHTREPNSREIDAMAVEARSLMAQGMATGTAVRLALLRWEERVTPIQNHTSIGLRVSLGELSGGWKGKKRS